ncbi:MAG: hypothetical protein HZC37_22000 [Burkholderiales bacterium]|nr:hypothetical protein [Burkholderiales bacterium]
MRRLSIAVRALSRSRSRLSPCTLGLALLAATALAHADAGLVLQAGMRAGSGFESANGGNEELHLRSGPAASLALEWGYDDHRLWQVVVAHQRTRLALGPAASPATAQQMPLRLTHLHIGGVNYFDGPVGSGPYVVGGLGLTQLTPRLPGTSTRTRASMNIGIGHEWPLAKSLAVRLELRAHIVAIGSDGAFFCSGGCTVAIRADTLTQAEAAVALRLGF